MLYPLFFAGVYVSVSLEWWTDTLLKMPLLAFDGQLVTPFDLESEKISLFSCPFLNNFAWPHIIFVT